MKQWVVAAALCLGALLGAGVVVLAADQGDEPDASLTTVAADDEAVPPGRERGERPKGDRGHGNGPPPWVRGGPPPWAGHPGDESRKPGKPSADWKRSWRDLTERQRDGLMAELAREHAAGMRRWKDCARGADAGEDRADCERPLPPGQAKKLSAP